MSKETKQDEFKIVLEDGKEVNFDDSTRRAENNGKPDQRFRYAIKQTEFSSTAITSS
jgi:hypothetical protein